MNDAHNFLIRYRSPVNHSKTSLNRSNTMTPFGIRCLFRMRIPFGLVQRMLRRALGVSLLTVLQGKMESRRCLVGFEAVKSFSFLSDMEPPFLNLGVDGDQEKRHESLSVAGCGA